MNKVYIENREGSYTYDGLTFSAPLPDEAPNRYYLQMQQELAGDVEIDGVPVVASIDRYAGSDREAADLAAQAEADAIVSEQERKMTGIEFEGVMCSATGEDMWGLASVKGYILAGMDLPPFKFENKSRLKLTQANLADFEAIWIPFRATFFE